MNQVKTVMHPKISEKHSTSGQLASTSLIIGTDDFYSFSHLLMCFVKCFVLLEYLTYNYIFFIFVLTERLTEIPQVTIDDLKQMKV